MKALIRITPILFLSFFILISCKNEDSSTNKEKPTITTPSVEDMPVIINGMVKSMKTKQGISGVAITIDGKRQSPSNGNGSFGISYNEGSTISVSYTRSGYESLTQEYANFDDIQQVTVYLEEASTSSVNNKSIRGIILKQNTGSRPPIPIKNVQVDVTFNNRTVSTQTNNNGFYSVPFTSPQPIYNYTYRKAGASNEIATITQRSSIKDSSDVDIIFDEAVGGIPLDTLAQ